jgi:hypothetical protein
MRRFVKKFAKFANGPIGRDLIVVHAQPPV